MAVRVEEPDNGFRFNQRCDTRRVAVEVDTANDTAFVEIPTESVETTVSREGVSDKNCLTEVYFPAEWYGESVIDEIQSFNPEDQRRYDTANVHWQDARTGEWYTVHRGYVRAVGGTGDPNSLRMWIGDPSDFLTAIPIDVTYGPQTTVQQVFEDVASVFEENTIFSNVRTRIVDERELVPSLRELVTTPVFPSTDEGGNVVDVIQMNFSEEFSDKLRRAQLGSVLKSSRSFHANRNVLSDVLAWVTEAVGGSWYFEFDGIGLVLVYDTQTDSHLFKSNNLTGEGIPVGVISNDAYQEILPTNAIRVNGQSRSSIDGIIGSVSGSYIPLTGKWPYAVATYPPLMERTGQALSAPVIESDALTVRAAEQFAKRKLKDMIGGSPLGDAMIYGNPFIEPGDRFRGVPICNSELDASEDVSPLDYEVQKITHTKGAGTEYKTRLEVSIYIDESQIEVSGDLEDGSDSIDSEEDEITGPLETWNNILNPTRW